MVAIAVQPLVLKDVEFIVEADDYSAHVSSVTFNPSSSTVTWQGLSPAAKFTDLTEPTWTCALEYAQDWTTADSLAEYLFTHQGETKAVTFMPQKGVTTGLPIFTANLIMAAGPIGGAGQAVAVGSVTLGVDGAPELSRVV